MANEEVLRSSADGGAGGVPWNFASIWEAVADVMSARPAVVQGDRVVSWRDYENRAARLAAALVDAGTCTTRLSTARRTSRR